jgi:hypothetical protein
MRRRGRKFPFFSGVPAGAIGALPLPAPTLTFRGNAQNTVDGTSWTTGSIAIGSASAARWVIACVYANGQPTGVSCSASGALTQLLSADFGRVKVFIGQVPAGTSATFTVTSNASVMHGLAVYTVENLASSAVRASAELTAASGQALDVNVLEGGFVIACGYGTLTPSFEWTGITENHETMMESLVDHVSASASNLPAASPRAVSVAVTSSGGVARGIAFSMR